jgi:2,3-bisphosphoglycerate-dependent phosphoglycerate mutase
LKESVARVVPYWEDTICPAVLDNKSVIVVAHGNSLRSIVKHLDNVSNEGIVISFN